MCMATSNEINAINRSGNLRVPGLPLFRVFIVTKMRHANDHVTVFGLAQSVNNLSRNGNGFVIGYTLEICRRN